MRAALTLVGVIQNGNAGNARNYLPNGLIGPGALAWLNDAAISHAEIASSRVTTNSDH